MPSRRWLQYLAIGLIAALAWVRPILTQIDSTSGQEQAIEFPRITEQKPATAGQPEERPAEQQQAADQAPQLPVGEDQQPKTRSTDQTADNNAELQKLDLEAQQRMAVAAERLFEVTKQQVALSRIESGLLFLTLLATAGAAWAAGRAAIATTRTVAVMQRVDRAYMAMSHKPPGLDMRSKTGIVCAWVLVENGGKTPAKIIRTHLQLMLLKRNSEKIEPPPYLRNDGVDSEGGFVIAGGSFGRYVEFDARRAPPDKDLWLIGYVDYIDVFGDKFRSRYARVYRRDADPEGVPLTEINNLVFGDQPTWNDDRPLADDD